MGALPWKPNSQKKYQLLLQCLWQLPKREQLHFLDSDSDGSVSVVRGTDHGSHLRRVQIDIAGVPATGLIDTGADITIMGPEPFKKVVAIVGLKKRQFKPEDKLPRTYDCRTFKLDGRLDLDVTFMDKTPCTRLCMGRWMPMTTHYFLREFVTSLEL